MILSGGRRVPSAFLPRRALRLGCCAAAAGFLLPPLAAGCFLAGSLLAGLFCAAGWVCFLGSFFAAALGCCLGLPSALPLAEEAFCSFWAAGFCSSAGLDLPVWPPWPFWPFLALACAGFCWEALGWPGFLAADFTGRSCGGGPCGGFLAAHHPFDLRRDLGGGFGAAALAEILPKDPVLLFTGCFGRSRYIILFFSHSCTSNSNLGSVFIFGLMYDVRPPIPFRRSCVLIHDKILHLAQIFWFRFYYTA